MIIAFELFAKLTLGVPAYAVGQGKMRKIRILLRFTNSASKFIQPYKGGAANATPPYVKLMDLFYLNIFLYVTYIVQIGVY